MNLSNVIPQHGEKLRTWYTTFMSGEYPRLRRQSENFSTRLGVAVIDFGQSSSGRPCGSMGLYAPAHPAVTDRSGTSWKITNPVVQFDFGSCDLGGLTGRIALR